MTMIYGHFTQKNRDLVREKLRAARWEAGDRIVFQALDEMEAEAAAGIIGHLETWAIFLGVPKTYGENVDGENRVRKTYSWLVVTET